VRKTLKNLFIKIKTSFSKLELLILGLALTTSLILITITITYEKPSYTEMLQPLFPRLVIRDVNGSRVDAFDTEFYVAYENTEEKILEQVKDVLDEYLVNYHKLFDRHHEYFALLPENEARPTLEEITNLPRLHNLYYLNDHLDEKIEVSQPLYEILLKGKDYTLNAPNGAFNMFIGSLYDFWKPLSKLEANKNNDPLNNDLKRQELERLLSFVPKTFNEINETLILEEEDDKYYATLKSFNEAQVGDFSISLGALAKGYMADVLEDVLTKKGLVNGLLYGGASTITFLKNGIYGQPFKMNVANIIKGENEPSFTFSRQDRYRMSTSGTYNGFMFEHNDEKVIRSHILNPLNGYPAQNGQQLVSVISKTLSNLELDYLTTTLIVLDETSGLTYLEEKYAFEDYHYIYLGESSEGYYAKNSQGFPGGENNQFHLDSAYMTS
jgi:thiamine biosynthesis lipoprotein ApbE